ncbi:hypothetical protein SAMN04489844_1149 [Nocardioides exalbidus]|uniref:Uncharacterized protein n=1 Tax=Nocardioides exalbidus TaxID=402596 RepID=A0A1H4MJ94_9ACTN|nr:hypothetical protein [Nocardioides exalbidus]SEB83069.1 hypothetical protein SAMN04489844_1149 [Nocardioides exalbidus]
MSQHDTGVTELLRRASDDLAPDVDRLVSGGVSRGRSRQRRARIGTTVASLAVIGVVGWLATVVPLLGDPDSARDPEIADGTGRTAGTQAADPDRPPPAEELRPLVSPDAMATTLQELTGATAVRRVEVDESAQDLVRLYYATVDGAQVSFHIRWYNNPLVVEDGGDPLAPSDVCEPAPDVDCTTLPDGSRLLREEVRPSGGTGVSETFLERSLTLATSDGWQIDVIARNTTDEKQGDVVAGEPVLTMAEMEALAVSDAWFARA